MKIKIYQINPQQDKNRKLFCNLKEGEEPDYGSYELAVETDVPNDFSLEDIFCMFNQPSELLCRSLSVSDIVEIPEKGAAYICQNIGWRQIASLTEAGNPTQRKMLAIEEKLKGIASELQMSTNELKEIIFQEKLTEHDLSDVKTWLENNKYPFTDEDVKTITKRYQEHYDSDYGIWDNIAASADAVKEGLSDVLREII